MNIEEQRRLIRKQLRREFFYLAGCILICIFLFAFTLYYNFSPIKVGIAGVLLTLVVFVSVIAFQRDMTNFVSRLPD